MKSKDLFLKNLDEVTFSVIDVETTGMNAEFNRVIDIGIVRVMGQKVVESWEMLINPEQDIPFWITEFTKLGNHDVRSKPTFSLKADLIMEKLTDTIFTAHNVNFDYWFLYHEMRRLGKKFIFPKICTVMLGRKLVPNLLSYSLDSLSSHYNISISHRHRALPDAQAAAELLIEYIKCAREKYHVKTFADLQKLQWLRIPQLETYASNFLLDDYLM